MLADDRSRSEFLHKVTVPTPLHMDFAAFFDKILHGVILVGERDLLVTARLIMIPKPQRGLRPIEGVFSVIEAVPLNSAIITYPDTDHSEFTFSFTVFIFHTMQVKY